MNAWPVWYKNERDAWVCDDASELDFAHRVILRFRNFSVPSFDRWASNLPEDTGKDELYRRRMLAKAALTPDGMRGHVEFLHMQRAHIERTDFLRPKAQRDEARQEGTRKERRPEISEWLSTQLRRNPDAKAPALWAIAPEWLTDDIGFGSFQKRVTAARKLRRK